MPGYAETKKLSTGKTLSCLSAGKKSNSSPSFGDTAKISKLFILGTLGILSHECLSACQK